MNYTFRNISRSRFLKEVSWAAGSVVLPSILPWLGKEKNPGSFLLSEQGCGRATGYAETNKIITWDDKTHIAWLDSEGHDFWVRIRTYDHSTGAWSQTYTIDRAQDNHGGPALTVDSKGFLHLLYYPHHEAMRYRQSVKANDASQWNNEEVFGQRTTYPTLICGPGDTLLATFRRSFKDRPWEVELWIKDPRQSWVRKGSILRSRYEGYAHFQESLIWNASDTTLHLSCRIHEKSDSDAYGRIQTVGYLNSKDLGHTWTTWSGEVINIPATAADLDKLALGGRDVGRILRVGGISTLQNGLPAVLYSLQVEDFGQSFLAIPSRYGQWKKINLNAYLPPPYAHWSLIVPGGSCVNENGDLYMVAQMQTLDQGDTSWGDSSNEIILFETKDLAQFSCRILSAVDRFTPNWLPSIERNTGHNMIDGNPWISYTSGGRGEKNSDILSNKVYAIHPKKE